MNRNAFLFLALPGLLLTACKDKSTASAVLPKACSNFPGTSIYKVDRRVLWVQTQVSGISSNVAESIFKQACQQAAANLGPLKVNIQAELSFDDKDVLIVGFRQYWVVWPVAHGLDRQGVPVDYKVMNEQMLRSWFQEKLGFLPTPDHISVITLDDVKNTPKGEPMSTHTLAQIQEEAKEKRAQALNDYVKQQELLQNP